jgi:DNA-binding LacI/PurR family transcriptional regulator
MNDRKGISDITRRKVLDVINNLKFIPNRNSRRLILKKSFNICLAMNPASSSFVDLFYFDITRGIVDAIGKSDYNLILCQLNYKADGRGNVPECVKNGDADGIIFLQDTPESILKETVKLQIPFILVDAEPKNKKKYISINLDAARSVRAAVEYLYKKGHRCLGFITSSYLSRYYTQTLNAFLSAMEDHKLAVRNEWVFTDASDEQSAYDGMALILENREKPTAIVCAGDRYAIGAMRCTMDNGLMVPGDISFIGMDNILISSYISPSLTTITYNAIEIGKTAVDMLMRMMIGEKVTSLIFPSESIIERDSVKEL